MRNRIAWALVIGVIAGPALAETAEQEANSACEKVMLHAEQQDKVVPSLKGMGKQTCSATVRSKKYWDCVDNWLEKGNSLTFSMAEDQCPTSKK
jgi:hypothetical protein